MLKFLKLIKNIYEKLTANIALNSKTPNVFLLRSRHFLLIIVLQILVREIRLEKDYKRHPDWK